MMSVSNKTRSCSRRRKRHGIRVIKVLEVGAGGCGIGRNAGEFARKLGSSADHRRILLRYANRRGFRGRGEPFRAITFLSSDLEPNSANDLRLDVHDLAIRGSELNMVVAIGCRGYGFANKICTRRFLSEAGRVLQVSGELMVIGRFVNPWFNSGLGWLGGRQYVKEIAHDVGLRVANFLTPLGRHPIAPIFRERGRRFIQRASNGRIIGHPSHFHRFIKNKAKSN